MQPIRILPWGAVPDWICLAISMLLVAIGAAMFRSDPDKAIIGIAFFGFCGIVSAAAILRRRRNRRAAPGNIRITGGIAIRPPNGRFLLLGGSLALLGTILVVFGGSFGHLFQAIAVFVALVGILIVAAIVGGWLPAGFLQFDPEGITIASRRWRYLVPWDGIKHVAPAELFGSPMLLVWLRDPGAIRVAPPDRSDIVMRRLAANERWIGAPIAIPSSHFGLELSWLLQAVERYAQSPSSRDDLAGRRFRQDDVGTA